MTSKSAIHKPKNVRTCIACRERFLKTDGLIRVTKDKQGQIFVDALGKTSGRGAYICACESCLQKCIKQRQLNKNFKCAVDNSVYEELESRGKINV